jgi:2-keto-4-pentenoate hydratase/2-oxohepta-3-ene-1,7-dioic acid hydratase in catechol pathway
MRFAALRSPGDEPRFARIDGDRVAWLDAPPWLGGKETGDTAPFSEGDMARLACPVRPSKIVGIGRNYAAHARELGNAIPGEPLIFLKPPSSLAGPGDAIALPPESERVEHEAELAVVIGRRAKNISEADALGHVLGYACACDVTARDLQRKDVQFTRAKGFDGFCPLGPWIETDLSPAALAVMCRVDGQLRQRGSTDQMIFSVPVVVSFVSRAMTLEPGDVILTGTPEGVGPLVAGNAVEIEIGGVGTLAFRVDG